ncbi:hypothetical protein BDW66DRAFT_142064 [Aspergillus desertorum]
MFLRTTSLQQLVNPASIIASCKLNRSFIALQSSTISLFQSMPLSGLHGFSEP